MYKYFNLSEIKAFYTILNKSFFNYITISSERQAELDELVVLYTNYFRKQSTNFLTLMNILAARLITSPKVFGLNNGDEMAYFYVMILDPELKYLELYEKCNNRDNLVNLYKSKFYIYDNILIELEKRLNKRFKLVDSNDLWSR